jgi:23S rRNA pseudouridine2605 synthase
MIDAVGHRTVHLIRTGFGNLDLGNLKPGQYRYLEPDELLALKRLVSL